LLDGDVLPLVKSIQRQQPGLVVGLTTHTVPEAKAVTLESLQVPLLPKPWTPGQLRDWVEQLLRRKVEGKEQGGTGTSEASAPRPRD